LCPKKKKKKKKNPLVERLKSSKVGMVTFMPLFSFLLSSICFGWR